MSTHKVILLRGPSGSGKSTWTEQNHPSAPVCSADHFFINQAGEYAWDPQKLGAAHGACQAKFEKLLKQSEPVVIVDNTMIKIRDMKWYYETASKYGFEIEVVEFRKPLKLILGRNQHGVPDEGVKRMHEGMQTNVLPQEWNVTVTIIDKD